MLDINKLIWVVPGIVGLWVYNSFLVVKLPQPEGWNYIFAIVFFASPYYILLNYPILLDPLIVWLDWPFLATKDVVLVVAIIASALFGLGLAAFRNLASAHFVSSDPLHNNCALWREKLVFITLENKEIYVGLLVDHTRDLRFEYSITIIPAVSGYRNNRNRMVWDLVYPRGKNNLNKMVIDRKKIVTFMLWEDSEAFKNAPQESSPSR